jgi:hypothetical protein
MDRNANVSRERRGHQVAFGDETDDLDMQPVGRTLAQRRGVGSPEMTDRDVPAETSSTTEDAPEPPRATGGISNREAEMEGDLTGGQKAPLRAKKEE